jgi:hypothetical protein
MHQTERSAAMFDQYLLTRRCQNITINVLQLSQLIIGRLQDLCRVHLRHRAEQRALTSVAGDGLQTAEVKLIC